MTFKDMSKLMAITAMSFLFCSNSVLAKTTKKKVEAEAEVEEETSKAITAAQRQIHKHGIGIGLGQTFLLGNYQNKGDNKITADIFYSYTASYSFDLLVNLHSSHHTYKEKEVKLKGIAMSIKARSYEYDAFSPFLLGGLGFYQPQIVKDGKESEAKNTFGFNLGAGLDLRLNDKVVAGLIGQYHNPFDVKQDDMEDVRGSYFKLLLTVMYLF